MKYYIMGKRIKNNKKIIIRSRNGFNRYDDSYTIDFDPTYHLNKSIDCDKINSKYNNLLRTDYYYDVYLIDFGISIDIACIKEVELDREFHSGCTYKLKDREYRGDVIYNSDLDRWEIHIDYTVETIEHENNVKVKELYDEYNRLLKEYYDTKEANDKLESENKEYLLERIKRLFSK